MDASTLPSPSFSPDLSGRIARSQSVPLFRSLPRNASGATRWVTRARPKIDRIACPWLVLRFIDPRADFLYVATDDVLGTAASAPATAYDIDARGVRFSHAGEKCSFDAFIDAFELDDDPALVTLATIVRGADTGRLDLAPECAGLLAVSLGLSRRHTDDHDMLRAGLEVYDALDLWARDARAETHRWTPL
jgi:hypothetical protein